MDGRVLRASLGNEPDLEDSRPQFSRNKQSFANWIVSDAIQDGFWFKAVHGAQKSGEVDPAHHITVCGEIRATRLLCHTLAKICPSTNSSSLS